MFCLSATPLGQSVPRLIGWSASPSTWTTAGGTLRDRSPSVWMMTPQLTEQYGQVDRVSVVRAIFSWRTWAKTGVRSNPRTDAARPPTALAFRNSRRVGSMGVSM